MLLLAGCSTGPTLRSDSATADPVAACTRLFADTDAVVADADVRDAGAARIEGFRWLRVNRPLATFRDEVEDDRRFRAWVDRLAELDRRSRRHELENLPEQARAELRSRWQPTARRHGLPSRLAPALTSCRQHLRTARLDTPAARDRLRSAAIAPDHYNTWQRVLGLYPLARRIARPRVEAFQAERAEAFRSALPSGDQVERYAAPADPPAGAAKLAREVRRDALGIPRPAPATRSSLFAAHAPAWWVITEGAADWPGRLRLDASSRPQVDTDAPAEYRRLSWTRFNGRILLQLNYLIWFPERPAEGWFDPYAGHLDGVLWRVTLAPDGTPLAYDSIHPCGCYYTLFPTPGWRVAEVPSDQEPVASPASAPRRNSGQRIALAIEPATHYLLALGTVERPVEARPLTPLRLSRLRSLPLPRGGSASAFDEQGLIPSSARAERFYFWPLGVPSAGAMRQWGTHAIAFVGRRHFDDPFLLQRLLRPVTAEVGQ